MDGSFGFNSWFREKSQCLGPREQAAVDGVNDWLRADLPTTEVATVKAFDCVLPTRHTFEFQIDVALSIRVKRNVHDMTILLLALGSHIVLELFDPAVAFFPVHYCQ